VGADVHAGGAHHLVPDADADHAIGRRRVTAVERREFAGQRRLYRRGIGVGRDCEPVDVSVDQAAHLGQIGGPTRDQH